MKNILYSISDFFTTSFVRTLAVAVVIVSLFSLLASTYRQAEAQDAPPPAASAALLELQRIAPVYDAWKAEEEKWNKAKQIITEVYGCRIAADRSAIDCSDFPTGSRPL